MAVAQLGKLNIFAMYVVNEQKSNSISRYKSILFCLIKCVYWLFHFQMLQLKTRDKFPYIHKSTGRLSTQCIFNRIDGVIPNKILDFKWKFQNGNFSPEWVQKWDYWIQTSIQNCLLFLLNSLPILTYYENEPECSIGGESRLSSDSV